MKWIISFCMLCFFPLLTWGSPFSQWLTYEGDLTLEGEKYHTVLKLDIYEVDYPLKERGDYELLLKNSKGNERIQKGKFKVSLVRNPIGDIEGEIPGYSSTIVLESSEQPIVLYLLYNKDFSVIEDRLRLGLDEESFLIKTSKESLNYPMFATIGGKIYSQGNIIYQNKSYQHVLKAMQGDTWLLILARKNPKGEIETLKFWGSYTMFVEFPGSTPFPYLEKLKTLIREKLGDSPEVKEDSSSYPNPMYGVLVLVSQVKDPIFPNVQFLIRWSNGRTVKFLPTSPFV